MAEADGEPDLPQEKLPSKNLLPESVWGQLKRLGRKSIPDERGKSQVGDSLYKNTHFGDELEMCEITQLCAEQVTQFVNIDNKEGKKTTLDDLSFMILIGDVGKAGSNFLTPEDGDSLVSRLYMDLFLDERHKEWLTNHTNVSDYPEDIQTLAEQFIHSEAFTSPVNFLQAPIALTLYVAQQVAIAAHPNQESDFKTRFACTEYEKQKMVEIGFPITETTMATFFSNAHIQAGELFLDSPDAQLTDSQKKLSIIGLSHHFSQNVLPLQFDTLDLSDVSIVKTIAYLEILDKVHAWVNRLQIKDAKSALDATRKFVMGNLGRNKGNIPNCPNNIEEIYEETFTFFENSGILEKL